MIVYSLNMRLKKGKDLLNQQRIGFFADLLVITGENELIYELKIHFHS